MPASDTIIRDVESAKGYDEQAQKTNWLGPQVVFGLAYEFVKLEQTLLDIGIGTGLSSILFHKAGLRVLGVDGSREVLDVCAAKNFAEDLNSTTCGRCPCRMPTEPWITSWR